MISLICPTARPDKMQANLKNWHDRANGFYYEVIIETGGTNAVEAINMAAKKTTGNILIVVSDDTDCPPAWHQSIMQTVHGKYDWILKTQDGIQPWIITMPIMDRAYYNRFGYIYHPDYIHMFCDTELSCVADLTGRRLTSSLMFRHNHYSVSGSKPDAISQRADSTWDQGKKVFIERYKRNFDLKPEDVKGKVSNQGMIDWIIKNG